MKLHQQFDLNLKIINDLGRELFYIYPYLIEKLTSNLTKKGYIVLRSSAYYMGVPQSITVVKEFTGPFVTNFSVKVKDDFNAISRTLKIEKLFE